MILHPLYKTPLKWIFFDLDNTLWDFDANAQEALKVLFERHQLEFHTGYKVEQFIHLYNDVNKAYWKKYERGEVDKEVLRTARFTDTFALMGLPAALYPLNVWQEYLDICPRMTILIPHAKEILRFLKNKVKIGILTNGFEETQQIKLKSSGLNDFIDYLQTSEAFGSAKPNLDFFKAALNFGQIQPEECLYIGDNLETDVMGGIRAGILTYKFAYQGVSLNNDLGNEPLFGGEVLSLMDWMNSL